MTNKLDTRTTTESGPSERGTTGSVLDGARDFGRAVAFTIRSFGPAGRDVNRAMYADPDLANSANPTTRMLHKSVTTGPVADQEAWRHVKAAHAESKRGRDLVLGSELLTILFGRKK